MGAKVFWTAFLYVSCVFRQAFCVTCPSDASSYQSCSGTGTSLDSKCTVCNGDSHGHLVKATCTDVKLQCIPNGITDLQVSDATSSSFPFGIFSSSALHQKTALVTLKLEHYGISRLRGPCFSDCSKLISLDLRKNDLSSLEPQNFQGLTSIQFLTLNQNKFTAIPDAIFQAIPTLRELYFVLNNIMSIEENDFQGLIHLTKLDLQSNKITTIQTDAFCHLVALENINLRSNQLTKLQANLFKEMKNLSTVNLQHNRLTYLDPSSFTGCSLTNLNLDTNQFTQIPTIFLRQVSNENLEINMARNMVTTIEDNAFDGVHLKTLFLVSNNISEVKPAAFHDSFVSKLDLEQNNIETLPPQVQGYINQSNSVLLTNNPWSCDCNIQLLVLLQKTQPTNRQLTCVKPAKYHHKPMKDIANDLIYECNPTSPTTTSTTSTKHVTSTTQKTAKPPTHQLFSITPSSPSKSTTDLTTTNVPPERPLLTPKLNITRTATTTVLYHTKHTTSKTSIQKNSKGSNSSNIGLIAGIVVGVLILGMITGAVVYLKIIRPKKFFSSKVFPDHKFPCQVPDKNSRTRFTVKRDMVNIIQE